MLLQLQVKNFAIIEDIEIKFDRGFHVLTGETGAGKSIIVDALNLLLGKRASKDLIRHGEDQALIEGVFFSQSDRVKKSLLDQDIELAETLIIRRTLHRDKPSISRVNGVAVTNSFLQELTGQLVDLAMQEDTGSLMHPQEQMDILDNFLGLPQKDLLVKMREKNSEIKAIQAFLQRENLDPQSRAREKDLLLFQIQEIEGLAFQEGEDEDLEKTYKQLKNAQKILEALSRSLDALNQDMGIRSGLDQVVGQLEAIASYHPDYEKILGRFESVGYELTDLVEELYGQIDQVPNSDEELYQVGERINAINLAKGKYGNTYWEIQDFYDQAKSRFDFLEAYDQEIDKAQAQLAKKEEEARLIASQLRKNRRTMAHDLELKILEELTLLDIKGGRFEIQIEEAPLSDKGMDQVTYFIATNDGEALMPLADIASGGEKSRIMLAFKSVLADYDQIETLIFDEIDAGMSGKTAQIVAQKMQRLAKNHQLIVISHLAQIAAKADIHYKIEKESLGQRTVSRVWRLEEDQRIEALALMISGDSLNQSARQTAKEMLAL
ncbi:MAG: DNA repair protein RecN [Tissierellia bacterium]|nr:DNA repair protein RecN [Tissierellia bacterium]